MIYDDAVELFFVVSGELERVVNGIWVPGDEAKKIAARWEKEP